MFVTSVSDGLLLAKSFQYKFDCTDNRLYVSLNNTKGRRILERELVSSNLAISNIWSDIMKR